MTIDWSKAPEGATHYDCRPHATPVFMQKIPDDSQRWNYWNRDGKLIYYGFMPEDQVAQMVQRPAAWAGEGPPPIGTVCEAKMPPRGVQMAIKEWTWRKVEVVRLNNGVRASEREVLVFDLENTAPAWVDELRPIRTAEQIAADEKRAGIEAIVAAFRYTVEQCTHCLPYSSAERLYEIGVRLRVPQ